MSEFYIFTFSLLTGFKFKIIVMKLEGTLTQIKATEIFSKNGKNRYAY